MRKGCRKEPESGHGTHRELGRNGECVDILLIQLERLVATDKDTVFKSLTLTFRAFLEASTTSPGGSHASLSVRKAVNTSAKE